MSAAAATATSANKVGGIVDTASAPVTTMMIDDDEARLVLRWRWRKIKTSEQQQQQLEEEQQQQLAHAKEPLREVIDGQNSRLSRITETKRTISATTREQQVMRPEESDCIDKRQTTMPAVDDRRGMIATTSLYHHHHPYHYHPHNHDKQQQQEANHEMSPENTTKFKHYPQLGSTKTSTTARLKLAAASQSHYSPTVTRPNHSHPNHHRKRRKFTLNGCGGDWPLASRQTGQIAKLILLITCSINLVNLSFATPASGQSLIAESSQNSLGHQQARQQLTQDDQRETMAAGATSHLGSSVFLQQPAAAGLQLDDTRSPSSSPGAVLDRIDSASIGSAFEPHSIGLTSTDDHAQAQHPTDSQQPQSQMSNDDHDLLLQLIKSTGSVDEASKLIESLLLQDMTSLAANGQKEPLRADVQQTDYDQVRASLDVPVQLGPTNGGAGEAARAPPTSAANEAGASGDHQQQQRQNADVEDVSPIRLFVPPALPDAEITLVRPNLKDGQHHSASSVVGLIDEIIQASAAARTSPANLNVHYDDELPSVGGALVRTADSPSSVRHGTGAMLPPAQLESLSSPAPQNTQQTPASSNELKTSAASGDTIMETPSPPNGSHLADDGLNNNESLTSVLMRTSNVGANSANSPPRLIANYSLWINHEHRPYHGPQAVRFERVDGIMSDEPAAAATTTSSMLPKPTAIPKAPVSPGAPLTPSSPPESSSVVINNSSRSRSSTSTAPRISPSLEANFDDEDERRTTSAADVVPTGRVVQQSAKAGSSEELNDDEHGIYPPGTSRHEPTRSNTASNRPQRMAASANQQTQAAVSSPTDSSILDNDDRLRSGQINEAGLNGTSLINSMPSWAPARTRATNTTTAAPSPLQINSTTTTRPEEGSSLVNSDSNTTTRSAPRDSSSGQQQDDSQALATQLYSMEPYEIYSSSSSLAPQLHEVNQRDQSAATESPVRTPSQQLSATTKKAKQQVKHESGSKRKQQTAGGNNSQRTRRNKSNNNHNNFNRTLSSLNSTNTTLAGQLKVGKMKSSKKLKSATISKAKNNKSRASTSKAATTIPMGDWPTTRSTATAKLVVTTTKTLPPPSPQEQSEPVTRADIIGSQQAAETTTPSSVTEPVSLRPPPATTTSAEHNRSSIQPNRSAKSLNLARLFLGTTSVDTVKYPRPTSPLPGGFVAFDDSDDEELDSYQQQSFAGSSSPFASSSTAAAAFGSQRTTHISGPALVGLDGNGFRVLPADVMAPTPDSLNFISSSSSSDSATSTAAMAATGPTSTLADDRNRWRAVELPLREHSKNQNQNTNHNNNKRLRQQQQQHGSQSASTRNTHVQQNERPSSDYTTQRSTPTSPDRLELTTGTYDDQPRPEFVANGSANRTRQDSIRRSTVTSTTTTSTYSPFPFEDARFQSVHLDGRPTEVPSDYSPGPINKFSPANDAIDPPTTNTTTTSTIINKQQLFRQQQQQQQQHFVPSDLLTSTTSIPGSDETPTRNTVSAANHQRPVPMSDNSAIGWQATADSGDYKHLDNTTSAIGNNQQANQQQQKWGKRLLNESRVKLGDTITTGNGANQSFSNGDANNNRWTVAQTSLANEPIASTNSIGLAEQTRFITNDYPNDSGQFSLSSSSSPSPARFNSTWASSVHSSNNNNVVPTTTTTTTTKRKELVGPNNRDPMTAQTLGPLVYVEPSRGSSSPEPYEGSRSSSTSESPLLELAPPPLPPPPQVTTTTTTAATTTAATTGTKDTAQPLLLSSFSIDDPLPSILYHNRLSSLFRYKLANRTLHNHSHEQQQQQPKQHNGTTQAGGYFKANSGSPNFELQIGGAISSRNEGQQQQQSFVYPFEYQQIKESPQKQQQQQLQQQQLQLQQLQPANETHQNRLLLASGSIGSIGGAGGGEIAKLNNVALAQMVARLIRLNQEANETSRRQRLAANNSRHHNGGAIQKGNTRFASSGDDDSRRESNHGFYSSFYSNQSTTASDSQTTSAIDSHRQQHSMSTLNNELANALRAASSMGRLFRRERNKPATTTTTTQSSLISASPTFTSATPPPLASIETNGGATQSGASQVASGDATIATTADNNKNLLKQQKQQLFGSLPVVDLAKSLANGARQSQLNNSIAAAAHHQQAGFLRTQSKKSPPPPPPINLSTLSQSNEDEQQQQSGQQIDDTRSNGSVAPTFRLQSTMVATNTTIGQQQLQTTNSPHTADNMNNASGPPPSDYENSENSGDLNVYIKPVSHDEQLSNNGWLVATTSQQRGGAPSDQLLRAAGQRDRRKRRREPPVLAVSSATPPAPEVKNEPAVVRVAQATSTTTVNPTSSSSSLSQAPASSSDSPDDNSLGNLFSRLPHMMGHTVGPNSTTTKQHQGSQTASADVDQRQVFGSISTTTMGPEDNSNNSNNNNNNNKSQDAGALDGPTNATTSGAGQPDELMLVDDSHNWRSSSLSPLVDDYRSKSLLRTMINLGAPSSSQSSHIVPLVPTQTPPSTTTTTTTTSTSSPPLPHLAQLAQKTTPAGANRLRGDMNNVKIVKVAKYRSRLAVPTGQQQQSLPTGTEIAGENVSLTTTTTTTTARHQSQPAAIMHSSAPSSSLTTLPMMVSSTTSTMAPQLKELPLTTRSASLAGGSRWRSYSTADRISRQPAVGSGPPRSNFGSFNPKESSSPPPPSGSVSGSSEQPDTVRMTTTSISEQPPIVTESPPAPVAPSIANEDRRLSQRELDARTQPIVVVLASTANGEIERTNLDRVSSLLKASILGTSTPTQSPTSTTSSTTPTTTSSTPKPPTIQEHQAQDGAPSTELNPSPLPGENGPASSKSQSRAEMTPASPVATSTTGQYPDERSIETSSSDQRVTMMMQPNVTPTTTTTMASKPVTAEPTTTTPPSFDQEQQTGNGAQSVPEQALNQGKQSNTKHQQRNQRHQPEATNAVSSGPITTTTTTATTLPPPTNTIMITTTTTTAPTNPALISESSDLAQRLPPTNNQLNNFYRGLNSNNNNNNNQQQPAAARADSFQRAAIVTVTVCCTLIIVCLLVAAISIKCNSLIAANQASQLRRRQKRCDALVRLATQGYGGQRVSQPGGGGGVSALIEGSRRQAKGVTGKLAKSRGLSKKHKLAANKLGPMEGAGIRKSKNDSGQLLLLANDLSGRQGGQSSSSESIDSTASFCVSTTSEGLNFVATTNELLVAGKKMAKGQLGPQMIPVRAKHQQQQVFMGQQQQQQRQQLRHQQALQRHQLDQLQEEYQLHHHHQHAGANYSARTIRERISGTITSRLLRLHLPRLMPYFSLDSNNTEGQHHQQQRGSHHISLSQQQVLRSLAGEGPTQNFHLKAAQRAHRTTTTGYAPSGEGVSSAGGPAATRAAMMMGRSDQLAAVEPTAKSRSKAPNANICLYAKKQVSERHLCNCSNCCLSMWSFKENHGGANSSAAALRGAFASGASNQMMMTTSSRKLPFGTASSVLRQTSAHGEHQHGVSHGISMLPVPPVRTHSRLTKKQRLNSSNRQGGSNETVSDCPSQMDNEHHLLIDAESQVAPTNNSCYQSDNLIEHHEAKGSRLHHLNHQQQLHSTATANNLSNNANYRNPNTQQSSNILQELESRYQKQQASADQLYNQVSGTRYVPTNNDLRPEVMVDSSQHGTPQQVNLQQQATTSSNSQANLIDRIDEDSKTEADEEEDSDNMSESDNYYNLEQHHHRFYQQSGQQLGDAYQATQNMKPVNVAACKHNTNVNKPTGHLHQASSTRANASQNDIRQQQQQQSTTSSNCNCNLVLYPL